MSDRSVLADLVIEGASEVVTCDPGAADLGSDAGSTATVRGGALQSAVGVIDRGVVASLGEQIVFVGSADQCRDRVALAPGGRRIDARGGTLLPGFVDPHTHVAFAGWREGEFEKRLAGASYLEIAASGGGILSTVRATRAVGVEDLAALVRQRLDAMLLAGTTTAEAKSGYGLSLDSEVAILKAIALASDHAVELIPTFLGPHVVAPEFREGRRDEYVRSIVEEMIPRVAGERLAKFCDVFVDEGAFTLEEAKRILEAARRLGLGLRVHAEQLTRTGATVLAASLGAASVDHLERATGEDVEALAVTWRNGKRNAGPRGKPTRREERVTSDREAARRGTVAVLLPGAALFLREAARPPARALIEAGVPVAIATDFNPGSSPCHAVAPILSLACLLFGLTPDEAIVAATRHAALSLGIEDRVGTLAVGKQADIVLWNAPNRRHLAYRLGLLPCALVVKRGRILVEDGRFVTQAARPPVGGSEMLVDLTVKQFVEKLGSDSPTPGGGSAAALAGAQGAALLEMVIAVTLKGEKFAAARPILEPIRARVAAYRSELSALVDRDAAAYDAVVAANRLPRETPEDKAARKTARDKALAFAAEVPLKTAELAAAVASLAGDAAAHINPNAASDLLSAAVLAEAALAGAAANVRINLALLKSEELSARASARLDAWTREAASRVSSVRAVFAAATQP